MIITVLGATGGTGRHIVSQALSQGHTVTALVRNDSLSDIQSEELHSVKGDVLNLEDVKMAIEGSDAVLCAIGINKTSDKSMLRTKGTRVIIEAMKQVGVDRLIVQSAFGALESSSALPLFHRLILVSVLLRVVFKDHNDQEKLVNSSNLKWTIVRPVTLTNEVLTGTYNEGFTVVDKSFSKKISRADTAHFMLKKIEDQSSIHRSIGISC